MLAQISTGTFRKGEEISIRWRTLTENGQGSLAKIIAAQYRGSVDATNQRINKERIIFEKIRWDHEMSRRVSSGRTLHVVQELFRVFPPADTTQHPRKVSCFHSFFFSSLHFPCSEHIISIISVAVVKQWAGLSFNYNLHYFRNIRLSLVRLTLPSEISNDIEKAMRCVRSKITEGKGDRKLGKILKPSVFEPWQQADVFFLSMFF